MRNFFALVMLAALLQACGLKGPLYLPQQQPAASPSTAATPAAGAQSDDKKNTVPPKK